MTDEASPLDYAAALAEAQRLGYAEADPAGDVEGLDAVNKLVILARLAFDRWLDPDGDPDPSRRRRRSRRTGHHDGQPGRPGRCPRGRPDHPAPRDGVGRAPTAPSRRRSCRRRCRATRPLGRTAGVRNRIEIDAVPVGRVGFDGPGAGGAATSSAVLGDLIAIAREAGSTWGPRPPAAATRDAGDTTRPMGDVLDAVERHPVPDR